jgi:hypothetical protein
MSGGSMDYAFAAINEAASQVYLMRVQLERNLNREGSRLKECFDEEAEQAVEDSPDKPQFHTGESLVAEVVKTMVKCKEMLAKAAICAKHAEWLQSDDIGYVTFCERVERDLAKADKSLAAWENDIDD